MQNLENDMDDLFRKAADSYVPKPPDSGWNEVAPQLSDRSLNSVVPVARKQNKRKKILLWLLPVAAATLGLFFTFNSSQKQALKYVPSSQQEHQDNKLLKADKENERLSPSNKRNDKKQVDGASITAANPSYNNVYNNDKSSVDKGNRIIIKNEWAHSANEGSSVAIMVPFTSVTKVDSNENTIEKKDGKEDLLSAQDAATTAKRTPSLSKQKRLYTGVVLGPSFNEVKYQGFKKAGFDIGVKAGYKLNRKLSVEGGIMFSKKYYFSDGKYFSMKTLGSSMPPGMVVLSLTGHSNVFEVPVTLKYNILQTKKASAFATAGISSYLLTKESNNYITVLNGSQQNMKGLYKNVSAGFASSVHLGLGYEHPLGKKTSLQVEPYVQLPLKGIGVGNMQMMSAGIHLSATLPVH